MHRYNNQLSVLRTDLRFCKRKSSDQAKQITELQNMLAEQQKQTLEYANRLDENDKKSDEMSSKISTLLQELNKCRIELHYYRSKSPATPFCSNCGQTTLTIPPDNLLAYINNSGREGIFNVLGKCSNFESEVQSHESCISQDLTQSPSAAVVSSTAATGGGNDAAAATPATPIIKTTPLNNKSNATNKMLLVPTGDNADALNAMHGIKAMTPSSSSSSLSLNLSTEPSIDRTSETAITTEVVVSAMASPSSHIRMAMPTIGNRDNAIVDSLAKRYKKPPPSNLTMGAGNWPISNSYEMIDNDCSLPSILASAISSTMATATVPASSSITIKSLQNLNGDGNDAMAGKKSIVNSGGNSSSSSSSVILTVGTPRFYGKRKLEESNTMNQLNDVTLMSTSDAVKVGNSTNANRLLAAATTTTTLNTAPAAITNKSNGLATNNLANSNLSDNYNKKARRVQNKLKIQKIQKIQNMNIKTRNNKNEQ